ncbi:MAG: methyl-accepting chemotaxis protein, partial [Bacteroidota bacterium]
MIEIRAYPMNMLSSWSLRTRISALLGTLALVTFGGFYAFVNYANASAEEQYQERSVLLARTVGSASMLNLMMQDTQGLEERLDLFIEQGDILAGRILDDQGAALVERGPAALLTGVTPPDSAYSLRWGEAQDASRLMVVHPIEAVSGGEAVKIGYVAIAIPTASLEAVQHASLVFGAGTALVVLFVLGLALFSIQRTVIRPVRALHIAIQAVEQGDLAARADVTQEDEIGALSASFNAMAEAAEQNLVAMEEKSAHAEAAQREAHALQHEAETRQAYLQNQFARIAQVVEAASHGDLSQRLTIEREDDIGALMEQMNHMFTDLDAMIHEVHASTYSVAEAAQHVASTAESMAQGTHRQDAETGEVAAAVEEMSATAEAAAQSAHQADLEAQRAAQKAHQGKDIFVRTAHGIERIAGIVSDATARVTSLGDSSARIGEIIRVISDIADQTNLLA